MRTARGTPKVPWAVVVSLGWLCCGSVVFADAPPSTIRLPAARVAGLDPARVSDVASISALSLVYEAPYRYAYLARPYRLEPALAADLPRVSEDGLTVRIPMRAGIRFQDDPCFPGGRGREVEASDLVCSLLRVADPRTQSPGTWTLRDRIVGLEEWRRKILVHPEEPVPEEIEGLRAVDRRTVEIRLTEPYPQLGWILAMNYACIVPREAVETYGDDLMNRAVGTGPFRLVEWRRNYRMIFERNPDWGPGGREVRYPSEGEPGDAAEGLLADAGRLLPLSDRVVFHVVGDPATSWLMFLAGELDASGVSRDNFGAVLTEQRSLTPRLQARGIRLMQSPQMSTIYIGFNMDDPVVGTNRALRRAVSCAIDIDRYIAFYEKAMIPANGPVPPGIPGSLADRPRRWDFDLDRARRFLQEAGYPDGIDPATGKRLRLSIEIADAPSAEQRQSVELLADDLDRIGIVLTANYSSRPAFFEKLRRRQFQLCRLSWVADYPDAQNFLQCFYGPNHSPGPNRTNYENPEFDDLYDRARTMPDGPERTALYERMGEIVLDDCPWVFLSHPLGFSLYQPWVRNVKPHDFLYGTPMFWRIDREDDR